MRGVILTAYNSGNSAIPYADLAILAACLIQKQIGPIDISLYADEPARYELDRHEIKYETLRIDLHWDDRQHLKNLRQFAGTTGEPMQFNNGSRAHLYQISDYDEMLILDSDYLLYENSLKGVWGSPWPIRMNQITTSVRYPDNRTTSRIGDLTIPLYWATAAYFRRCPETDRFFALTEYVRENYAWFSNIYRYDPRLYRNDYVFSIAAHILGGEIGSCPSIGSLPNEVMRFAWDDDEVVGEHPTGLWIAAHDHKRKRNLIQTRDQSIHVLNKPSLGYYLNTIIDREYAALKSAS